MNKKIIALKGRGESGKTTTINMLPAIFLNNDFRQVPNMFQNHGSDFLDIFENGKLKVGLTSSGDTFDLVNSRLTDLVNAGCDVCICACRTADRIPPGTIAATQNFPDYQVVYIPKSYANGAENELKANTNDANSIFRKV